MTRRGELGRDEKAGNERLRALCAVAVGIIGFAIRNAIMTQPKQTQPGNRNGNLNTGK